MLKDSKFDELYLSILNEQNEEDNTAPSGTAEGEKPEGENQEAEKPEGENKEAESNECCETVEEQSLFNKLYLSILNEQNEGDAATSGNAAGEKPEDKDGEKVTDENGNKADCAEDPIGEDSDGEDGMEGGPTGEDGEEECGGECRCNCGCNNEHETIGNCFGGDVQPNEWVDNGVCLKCGSSECDGTCVCPKCGDPNCLGNCDGSAPMMFNYESRQPRKDGKLISEAKGCDKPKKEAKKAPKTVKKK